MKSGAYPSAQVPYVKPRDPLCSRIDIVALQGNQSALNVKGRTLGHFDGLRLKKSDGGQAKFESGQLAFMPQVDPKSPPAQCPAGPVPPLTVNTEGKQLIIDGVVVGTFDAFSLTADNLAKSKTSPIFALWKSIQVDASKPRVLVSVDDRPGEIPPFTIPGSIGAGSGGTAGIGGVSPTPPKQIHCTPGQGRVCPD